MSDSSRRASVELPLDRWHRVTQALSALSIDGIRLDIENQLPAPLPTGLGAVVEARTEDGRGGLYVSVCQDTDVTCGWRKVQSNEYANPDWRHGHELDVIRVLSEGIAWPA